MSSGSDATIRIQQRGPGCLVTLLWFVFVGWWLSAIWIILSGI